jgi:hypothetical protein
MTGKERKETREESRAWERRKKGGPEIGIISGPLEGPS